MMDIAEAKEDHEMDAVYTKTVMYDFVNVLNSIESQENDLKSFKEFLEKEYADKESELGLHNAISGIRYGYNLTPLLYTENVDGTIIHSDINAQINELLKASIQSEGVINLFDSKQHGEKFSLFDPAVLEEIGKMKEKNIAVEILRKLMAEQVSIYKRTNVVQSQKFSEKITQLMNAYYNGLITNEEVIKELLETAAQIAALHKQGETLGLTEEEMAFYDALTKPEAIIDFYSNDELVALTRELTEQLRKNRTIDWQQKESARASMRVMVKRLLKRHKYPPEGMEDAISTVMSQCEMWTDN
jgi:type I restriction enzyme R subunit